MEIIEQNLFFQTQQGPQFIDITEEVGKILKKSRVRKGIVLIYSKHTTAAIRVNENEPLLIADMEKFLKKLASPSYHYEHNDFRKRTVNMCSGECANGHSHCQHLLLGTSETIPVIDGKMVFGPWQRIFLIELDHARKREVVIMVMGEQK